jgi:hypothetical protein
MKRRKHHLVEDGRNDLMRRRDTELPEHAVLTWHDRPQLEQVRKVISDEFAQSSYIIEAPAAVGRRFRLMVDDDVTQLRMEKMQRRALALVEELSHGKSPSQAEDGP